MQWNDLLKEVGARFKHRSWLLIDQPHDSGQGAGAAPAQAYPGVTLVLDCDLDGVFQLLERLEPGVGYAASLKSADLARAPGPYQVQPPAWSRPAPQAEEPATSLRYHPGVRLAADGQRNLAQLIRALSMIAH